MRTLKRLGALVVAGTVLFAMTGCKKKAKAHEGAKSAEELVTKVIDYINGDIKFKEVKDWIDWYGWVAYYIGDKTGIECDFPTVRAVIDDLEEGPDYIKKHHKEFAEAYEDATGDEINKKDLKKYIEYKKEIDDLTKDDEEEIYEQFREFAPYDNEFDEDNLYEREDSDFGSYSIPIDDEEYHYLEIQYYIDDGKYVCFGINYVC